MSAYTSQRRKAAVAFIFITACLDVLAMGIVSPVLPTLLAQFTGSSADAGWWNGVLLAAWGAMQFIGSPLLGCISDRYGRRPVILISTAGLAANWLLMALAPNLWWFAAARLLTGLTSASFSVVYAYMADITAPAERARAYGLIGAAFSGGFVLGPALGGLLGAIDPRAPFWAAGAMSTIAFLYGVFVLPESLALEKRAPFNWGRANPFGAIGMLVRHAELFSLATVNFLYYFAQYVFSAVFVLYAAFRYDLSSWHVGLLLAFVGLLDMFLQSTIVGPLVRRFGDRAVMIAALSMGGLGLVIMGLAPNIVIFTCGVSLNVIWGLAMPTLQSLMTNRVSESEQGQLQGANMSVASIAGVIAPLFFGWIYWLSAGEGAAIPHIGASFFIAAAVLFTAAMIGLNAGRRRAGLAAEQSVDC